MIVCLCHGVNDRKIRETIEAGAETVRDVGQKCGAGTDCGGCKRQIKQLIVGHDALRVAMAGTRKPCPKTHRPLLASHARQP